MADSQYFPYSLQTPQFIEQRVVELCHWMEKNYPLQALIMACNTASATTYADLVEYDLPFPVYEPIGVTCEWIKKHCKAAKNIMVLATPVTVATNAYLTNLSALFDVTQLSSAELVQAIEQGVIQNPDTPEAKATLEPLSQLILSHEPDILVLGSTHFSWAKDALAPYLPQEIQIVDSAECLTEQVVKYNIQASNTQAPITDIITTIPSADFNRFVASIPLLANNTVQVPEVTNAFAARTA